MYILSIESSCDETSVCVLKDTKILSHIILTQILIHQEFGGVVPEIASRNHIYYMVDCLDSAIKESGIELSDLDYIAVTEGPGLIGSLLVGITCATSLAYALGIPVIGINHLMGHIYAAFLDNDINFPVISLLISGGHTELIYMKDHYDFKVIGRTLDDACGESYDKVARTLGLKYPGGPEIDREAKKGDDIYKFPRVYLSKDSLDFSFSGLKSHALNLVNQFRMKGIEFSIPDVCSSFQESVVEVLYEKSLKAMNLYGINAIIIGGGVACNSRIREKFNSQNKYKVYFPSFKNSTDNAAMIGISAYYYLQTHKIIDNNYIITSYSTSKNDL
jgi:N6-L-threonylcarbamoyladenine synthase